MSYSSAGQSRRTTQSTPRHVVTAVNTVSTTVASIEVMIRQGISTSRAIVSGSAAAAAALVVGVVVSGRETNGKRTRLGGVSLSEARATCAGDMSPFRLLGSKSAHLLPVAYAKEAENIVLPSGARGSSNQARSKPQSDRPNDAKTAIEESTRDINTLEVDNTESSGLRAAGDDARPQAQREKEVGQKEDEEDEETTCPFCLFQRRGPCGKQWRAWEKCIARAKKADEDFVSRCSGETGLLMECTFEHPEYYQVLEETLLDDPEGDIASEVKEVDEVPDTENLSA